MKHCCNPLLLIVFLLIVSCSPQAHLEVEDYFNQESRNHYLIIRDYHGAWGLENEAKPSDDSQILLNFSIHPSNSSSAKDLASFLDLGEANTGSVLVDPWLLDGEELEIYQSKVAFQRAIVITQNGERFIAECFDGSEVSAYSFRDDFIEYGAKTIIPISPQNNTNNWYRYGGTVFQKGRQQKAPSENEAYLIISK